jgi:VCBS repeat-containing protein
MAVTGAMQTSADPLRFGGNAVWGEWFSGRLDEIRIYNRALTAAAIQTDMITPVAEALKVTAVNATPATNGTVSLTAGSITYQPAANAHGTASFEYIVCDSGITNGVLDSKCSPGTVNVTLTPVSNVAPVATSDSYSVNEDTALNVTAPGVLGNDTDADGNPLTAVLVSGPSASQGSLTLSPNGSFGFTPALNFNGPATFTYKANDGIADSNTATVTITVNAVNDPPAAASDSYSVTAGTTLNVTAPGVLGNDSDVEGSPLTAAQVTGPAKGTLTLNANGSFSYVSNAGSSGTDAFTYSANDGTANSNTATVTITIIAGNQAPVATSDSYSVNEDTPLNVTAPGVLGNDTDADGNPLTAVLVSGPSASQGSLTLNANGSFGFTPALNFNGPATFTYKANDGSLDSNTATVTITVNAVNDAPIVNAGPDLTTTLPGSATLAGVATDVDSSVTIGWSKVSGPGTVTFVNASSPATTATFSAAGAYVLALTANDGQFAVSDTASVAVNAANMALQFDGVSKRVTFGAAPGLGASTFTIETWFKREGAGLTVSTGTGGLAAIPLVTKGMAQADGSNVDMNYFLGIDGVKRVLAADFEDMATGLNHPVQWPARDHARRRQLHATIRQHSARGSRRRVHLDRCGEWRVPRRPRRAAGLECRAQRRRRSGRHGRTDRVRTRSDWAVERGRRIVVNDR